jgi:predicted nucleic acid-binding protein
MNGDVFVLDSNFILDYLKGYPEHVAFMREHEVKGSALRASVITEIELFSFPTLTDGEKKILDSFMNSIAIAPLDSRTKDIAISFRRITRRKLPDSIIAATAINLRATLVTSDQNLLKAGFPGFVASAL